MVSPGFQEMLRGRVACVESYREFAANAKVHDYTESDLKIAVWGDTAVCTYAWSMTYQRDGEQSREAGTDQFVLSREGKKWLAVYRYIHFAPTETR
jgi:ketosteroid isomerase-like protein